MFILDLLWFCSKTHLPETAVSVNIGTHRVLISLFFCKIAPTFLRLGLGGLRQEVSHLLPIALGSEKFTGDPVLRRHN